MNLVQHFIYREHTRDFTESTISHWTLEHTANQIALKVIGSMRGSAHALFSPNWEYEKWVSPGFTLQKEGEKLQLTSATGRKENFENGSIPWIQDLTLAMAPFVQSDQKDLVFCVVNPDDYSKIDLYAKKERVETVHLPEGPQEGLRVKFTLTGWRRHFWSCIAHFHPQEGHLLRIEANTGPGTPTIIQELISKKNLAPASS